MLLPLLRRKPPLQPLPVLAGLLLQLDRELRQECFVAAPLDKDLGPKVGSESLNQLYKIVGRSADIGWHPKLLRSLLCFTLSLLPLTLPLLLQHLPLDLGRQGGEKFQRLLTRLDDMERFKELFQSLGGLLPQAIFRAKLNPIEP